MLITYFVKEQKSSNCLLSPSLGAKNPQDFQEQVAASSAPGTQC